MENSTAAYFNGSELEEEYAKILEVCTSIYICGRPYVYDVLVPP